MRYKRSLFVLAAALVGVLLTVQMFAAFNTAEAGPVVSPPASVVATTDLPMIADFEGGVPAGWFVYGDWDNIAVDITNPTIADTGPLALPGQVGTNDILSVTANVPSWAGFGASLSPVQDWSDYDAVSLWFYGENSGTTHEFEIQTAQNVDRRASFVDSFTGWRQLVFPFSTFGDGGAYDLSQVDNWVFVLDGTVGSFKMDNLQLVNLQPFADFEDGVPAGWFVYGDWDNITVDIANPTIPNTDTLALPGQIGANAILSVTANIPTWSGFGASLNPVADWSDMQGISFWFYGTNISTTHEFELQTAQGDDRRVSFVDNFDGWKFMVFPFTSFGTTPYDVSQVDNWVFVLDGTIGSFKMDNLNVYGDAGNTTLRVQFDPTSYSVTEGETATVSVTLNITSTDPITVTYATADDTATAGADYTAATGSLVFAPGDMIKSFTVATMDDPDDEPAEKVNLSLSNPMGAELGNGSTAVLTIKDNDQAPPVVGGGHSVVVDSYEYTAGLPMGNEIGVDGGGKPYTIPVGYVTWSYDSNSSAITLTVPAEQRPGAAANNQVMQLDLNLGSGNWGGFSHNFENAAMDKWVAQDWSAYAGVSLWLYGNNTGGVIFLDIMDNRTAGSTKDDAERWSTDIPDDFSGWKYIEIPFGEFNRKDIGNGAPDDGFNKTAINGYGIGGFGSAPMLDQVYYIDNLGLIPRTTVVDAYEYTTGLPLGNEIGTDPATGKAYTIPVGYVTWSYDSNSSAITLTVPAEQVPGAATGNQVMQLDLNLGSGNWGGFSHNFENAAMDQWVPQDWSTYEGVCFWLYGNNTGGVIFLDIMDNRTAGSIKDDAERWSTDIPDDFSGWKFIQIPFSQFNRKDIGNGAPDDGFNKTQVNGYGIGGFGSAPMLNQTYYIDDLTVYGNTGNVSKPLELAFSAAKYSVAEGQTAMMTVSLATTSTMPVTVTYKTAEGSATPGVDYTPVSGTLVFAPGEMDKTISVPTLDDAKFEGNEAVMVNLYDVDGAAFGFQRRAMLTIVDNEVADLADLGDFEGSHPFQGVGGVSLSITALGSADPNALPGQGATEQVLTVQYNDTATTTNRIINTFTTPQDWSGANGLTFWYFGSNTGKTINVELWDNQITGTNALTATDWVMRWADEFNEVAGTPPNPNNWQYEIGDGTLNGIPGWGNSEFEFYTDDPANASTDGDGNLVISLKALDTDTTDKVCYYGPCRYTSARLKTANLAEFQYGKIEARMKLPPTTESGIWPAFWSLGSNIDEGVDWPQSGEIDIMEYVSRIPNEIFGTLHGPGYSGGVSYGKTVNVPNLLADFHTFSIEWWENHIIWYVDGVKFHETRNTDAFLNGKEWVYNHPFFLLLNVAIGGNFGGAISPSMTFPQDTLVDYVRVYQAPLQAELFNAGFVDDFTGWKKIFVPFSSFTRSADQPAGAPNDGLTLTSVNGYGFRFPSASTSVSAQAQVTTMIDQVKLVTFVDRWFFPLIFGNPW